MAASCYADAEMRYTRWLEQFQLDRSRHARYRRAHPDPAALDAELGATLDRMGRVEDRYHLEWHEPDLRGATDLLLRGARVSGSFHHQVLDDIINMLDSKGPFIGRAEFVHPDFRAFLDALTASGSVLVLDGIVEEVFIGEDFYQAYPFWVLQTVVKGHPWAVLPHDPGYRIVLDDLAVRRVCLRLLARMTFLSAERDLGRGESHPFMVLLQTRRIPRGWTTMYPFGSIETAHVMHPINHAAFLQVVHLMMFVYRRFPWPGRQQHLADAEDAMVALSQSNKWDWVPFGIQMPPFNTGRRTKKVMQQCKPWHKMMRLAAFVPGFLEVLLEHDLGHLFTAYCFAGCLAGRQWVGGEMKSATTSSVKCGIFPGNFRVFFSSRKLEDRLIRLFRYNGQVSRWICGGGRCLLLDFCRQRRRRVIQVTSYIFDFSCLTFRSKLRTPCTR